METQNLIFFTVLFYLGPGEHSQYKNLLQTIFFSSLNPTRKVVPSQFTWTKLPPPPTPTSSGLPLGAVLLTTLFSLYLSDMLHPPNTHLTLYAEDTALCRGLTWHGGKGWACWHTDWRGRGN